MEEKVKAFGHGGGHCTVGRQRKRRRRQGDQNEKGEIVWKCKQRRIQAASHLSLRLWKGGK
ncbi:hypothetical protein HPP92_021594 [Vanilla planifolia]|uniref:Uncharacterized protein n=1 Tax=Vanilla planifolia TaxID=51239 RepID=A0A835UIX4_VANPL|nr:hypothetical protein HPP92_021594 [Vanilla planifolia]